MKLYYSHRSPYVRLVMVALHWCDLADRVTLMNTVVDITRPSPELSADNPLNKIPTLLLDDGEAIYDSRVICEYLDTCHSGLRLFPRDRSARLAALRRLALGHGTIDLLLAWLLERNRSPDTRSVPFIVASQHKFGAVADRMNAEVPELNATPFTIGHAAIGTALSYADFRFPEQDWRARHAALAEWHAAFMTIPAVAADPFFDDLAAADR